MVDISEPNARLVVPDRTNSQFSEGQVYWSLIHDVAALIGRNRIVDEIDFRHVVHLKPYAVALVVGVARQLGSPNLQIVAPVDDSAKQHLTRLGVPLVLNVDWGEAILRATNVPLEVVSARPPADFSYRVSELLAREFPGGLGAGMMPRIADSIDEMILNSLAHSESSVGCVVVGQSFPSSQSIEVAIVDFGITIRGHLSRKYPNLSTDELAIREAVKEGITGTPSGSLNRLGDPNSGVGLSELAGFVESTGGELAILSGSSLVCFGSRIVALPLKGQPFPGTLINIRFNTAAGRSHTPAPRMLYS